MKPILDIGTLTAYALGELEPAMSHAVENALKTEPDASKTVEELRATARFARTALRAAPQAALTERQRATVMERAEAPAATETVGARRTLRQIFLGNSVAGSLLRAAAVLLVIGALYWNTGDISWNQPTQELAKQGVETADDPNVQSLARMSGKKETSTEAPATAPEACPTETDAEWDLAAENWEGFEVVPSNSSSAAVAVLEEKPPQAPLTETEAAATEPAAATPAVEAAPAPVEAPPVKPEPMPAAASTPAARPAPDPSVLRVRRQTASPEIVSALDALVSNKVFGGTPSIQVRRDNVTALDGSTLSITLDDSQNSVLVLETTPEAVENVLLQDRFVLAMAQPEPAPPITQATPPAQAVQKAAGESVALPIELPEKSFMGTPLDYWSENLEFTYTAREPFMVPAGTELLSRGKPVTSSDPTPSLGRLPMITDGDKGFQEKSLVELDKGLQWVQVDLGQPCSIEAIVVWHFHTSERVYHDFSVHIADDPDFTQNVRTLYNNDHDNSAGLGAGEDKEYVESNEGRLISGHGEVARYVRLYSRGNTSNERNNYVEVEVWGRTGKDMPLATKDRGAEVKPRYVYVPVGGQTREAIQDRVALRIEVPEKSFMGTPLDYWSENLEFSYEPGQNLPANQVVARRSLGPVESKPGDGKEWGEFEVVRSVSASPASPPPVGSRGLQNLRVGGEIRTRDNYAPVAAKGGPLALGMVFTDQNVPLDTSDHPDFNNDPNLVYWPGHNTEAYDHLVENPFRRVADEALSTFSIDVDTASYANTRRFLNQNTLPPPGAVRIEEFINYFDYDYAPPDGEDPFAVHVEVASCPWKPEHRLARIGLKGREIPLDARPACNLVFLIDVSGSMQPENKLPLLKRALEQLVTQLREDDRVAIAVYAGASGLVLPPTSGDAHRTIIEALNNLRSGGSTNGGEGIKLAYNTATESFLKDGVNRVILATDGDFNVGMTDTSQLIGLVEKKAKTGVFLSVLGFGMGNLKDSTLEQLADKGNGNYAYIDDMDEARKVLVTGMLGTLICIAKDVKIQVEFNPAQVQAYRLIGYENRILAKEDFNDDTKDAGEIGAGHTVTALYELVPPGVSLEVPGVDPLKYQQPRPALTDAAGSGELFSLKLRYKKPDQDNSRLLTFPVRDDGAACENASEDFRFAAAAAGFGMLLRNSEHRGALTYELVLTLAEQGLGREEEHYRAEFIGLVRKAHALASQ